MLPGGDSGCCDNRGGVHAPAHLHVLTYPRKAVKRRKGVGEADRRAEEGGNERQGRNDLDETLLFAGSDTRAVSTYGLAQTLGENDWKGRGQRQEWVDSSAEQRPESSFVSGERRYEPPFCPCPGHAFQAPDCL